MRLSKKQWVEIEELLKDPNRNITKISRQFNISRHTLYERGWRKKLIPRKKKGFWERIKRWYGVENEL